MIDYDHLQKALGFTEEDKANWLEVNGKYYIDQEQGWRDKLMMHSYPQRSASVYVMPAYQSPVTNKWIDTPAQRRDDLARSGSRPWEGMDNEKKEAKRRAEALDQNMDKLAEKMTIDAWQALPEVHREALQSA
jgi:hypothetical protein